MLKPLVIALLIGALAAPCLAAEEEQQVGISGQVVDENNRPVPNALVIIRDRESKAVLQLHTDRTGHYDALHAPAKRCSLRVVPSAKSGFAQAMLPDVPTDEGRHFVVSVHRGFLVKGHVLCEGKPAKGVRVRVTSEDNDTVHGGAETLTDGKGNFAVSVTPGAKQFEFSQRTPGGTLRTYRTEYSVSADGTMSDISMTSSVAGAAK